MQKKSEDFSVQEAMRLAKSPAGQQLLALLQQKNGSAMQQAAEQVSNGEYSRATETLQQLLSSDEARLLLSQLGR